MTGERALVRSFVKTRELPKIETIDDDLIFVERCNGGVNLEYHSTGVEYEVMSLAEWLHKNNEKSVPDTVVFFTHPSGEKGAIIVAGSINFENERMAAVEITDSICQKVGCKGGENCFAKRISR